MDTKTKIILIVTGVLVAIVTVALIVMFSGGGNGGGGNGGGGNGGGGNGGGGDNGPGQTPDPNRQPFIGMIVPYNGNDIPDGWLLCDGRQIDTNKYPELKSILNCSFECEDLNNNIPNLPDLRGIFPIGAAENLLLGTTGGNTKMTIDQLPYHNHRIHASQKNSNEIDKTSEINFFNQSGFDDMYYTGMDIYKGCSPSSSCPSENIDKTSIEKVDSQQSHYPPYISLNYIIYTGVLTSGDIDSTFILPINSIINAVNKPSNFELFSDSKQKFIKGCNNNEKLGNTGGDDKLQVTELIPHKHNIEVFNKAGSYYSGGSSVLTTDTTRTSFVSSLKIYDTNNKEITSQKEYLPPYMSLSQYKCNNADNMAIGTIILYAGDIVSLSDYFLPCDGNSYDITRYSALYDEIKSVFGSNTPNLTKRMVYGNDNNVGETGGDSILQIDHLPEHGHMAYGTKTSTGTGTYDDIAGSGKYVYTKDTICDIDCKTYSITNSSNVSEFLPPYLALNYVIYAGPPNNSVEQYTPNNMKLNSFVL